MRVRDGLQAVELDEDDAPDDDTQDDDAPDLVSARRRRWPWLAAAALLVAVLAGGQHVLDVRHVAHQTRFDHVPGVVLPIGSDPFVRWRWQSGEPVAGEAAGRIVTFGTQDHEAVVRGLDRTTGRADWTTHLPLLPAGADTMPDVECRPVADAAGRVDRVACLLTPDDVTVVLDRPADASLVLLDAATGATLAQQTVPMQVWGVAGDVVVTAAYQGGGAQHAWAVTATRSDGTPAWSRALDPWAVPRAGRFTLSSGVGGDAVHVLLHADAHAAVLDTRDGTVAQLDEGTAGTAWTLARGGLLVRWDVTSGASENGSAIQPASLVVDDGSAPDVALGGGAGVAGYDARTGRQLWHDPTSATMLLGGRVYGVDGRTVVALDARTGRRVWTHALDGEPRAVLTDGRVVYVHVGDSLVRLALDDGKAAAPLPLSGLENLARDEGGDDTVLQAAYGVLTLRLDDTQTAVLG